MPLWLAYMCAGRQWEGFSRLLIAWLSTHNTFMQSVEPPQVSQRDICLLHSNMCTHLYVLKHTHTHERTHERMHTQTNAHMNTCTHAHTRTTYSNLVVALMKMVAYVYTGSAAMLSETVHSLVDCLNQVRGHVRGQGSYRTVPFHIVPYYIIPYRVYCICVFFLCT